MCYCSAENTTVIHKKCKCGCYDINDNDPSKADKDLCCINCPDPPSCFPGESRLLLDNGQTVEMKDVRAGQRILTGKSDSYI